MIDVNKVKDRGWETLISSDNGATSRITWAERRTLVCRRGVEVHSCRQHIAERVRHKWRKFRFAKN